MSNPGVDRSRELLAQVAVLYYERNLPQREIADLLHVSRSTVSRMLDEARELGIVEVRISRPSFGAMINWRQVAETAPEEGVTLHVFMVKHSFTDSLLALLPTFEELTGIKVLPSVLPQEEYWRKLTSDLSSGGGLIDVFTVGPELDWRYIPGGWIESLDPYLKNPTLTDPEWYKLDDFYPEALAANRWDGKTTGQGTYGRGPLYAIPVTYEIMSLAYRADLLEAAGIRTEEGWPHTWDDVFDAARKLTRDTNGDGEPDQYGIITRGVDEWTSMYGGYSNYFYSSGGRDIDDRMNPVVNSPEAVALTERWVDLVRECAPPETPSMTWMRVRQAFAAGRAAMLIDCDWFAATTFERPEFSNVAGKLKYALTPPGPQGQRVADLWFWSLGINANSYHKEAAWLFIQWATSRTVMLRATADYGNWNPSRRSVWEDASIVALSAKWANYRQIVEASRKQARIPHTVAVQVTDLGDAWWHNIREAIQGHLTTREALDLTAAQMREILDRDRLSK